jgi:hypothetical protein
LKRAISSAAGIILPTLPMPWPLPQISFQAFGLARSPDASVPKLIFDASDCGRLVHAGRHDRRLQVIADGESGWAAS